MIWFRKAQWLMETCQARFATLTPSRPQSERIYRRAITETPGRDAEVLVRGTAQPGGLRIPALMP